MGKRRSRWVAWVLLPALAPGCSKEDSRPGGGSGGRPNIVLITLESLRTDHVGCYGYGRDTTPHIDALARQATRFDQARSVTSWTLTAHASLFTGLYPTAHKVILPKDRLGDDYTTLAEALSACGYQTAAIVSGPYLRTAHNLNQGFELYDDSPITPPDKAASRDVTNPRMKESVERFLRERRDARRPFFLFLYYWDPHHDYIPPPPYDAMFVPTGAQKPNGKVRFDPWFKLGTHLSPAQLLYLVAQYDGEIRCTDECLGRLWDLLRELNLWDETAIIVTADHGEEFYEHGHNGHKNTLYVESVHVPLLLKRPGQQMAERDDRPVSLLDLFPTVLDLAGCEARWPHNGQSLLEPAGQGERATFFELVTTWSGQNRKTGQKWVQSDDWIAVRQGRYTLIHVRNKDQWELYDVVTDPGERTPLGQGHDAERVALKERLNRWYPSMTELGELWTRGPQAALTEEEEQRLRSLGYLP